MRLDQGHDWTGFYLESVERYFAALLLQPLLAQACSCEFIFESHFTFPEKYIKDWLKDTSKKHKGLAQINKKLAGTIEMHLIFAEVNKAGFFYEQGQIKKSASHLENALSRLDKHGLKDTYENAFAQLKADIGMNWSHLYDAQDSLGKSFVSR